MRSIQLGSYDRMFKNVIESYSGYLQLQHQDYFDDPVLDNSFETGPELINKITDDPNIIKIVPGWNHLLSLLPVIILSE